MMEMKNAAREIPPRRCIGRQPSIERNLHRAVRTEADRCSVAFRLSRERRRQLKINSIASNKTTKDVLSEAVEMFIKAPRSQPKFGVNAAR